MRKRKQHSESGYVIIGVLLVMSLSFIVTSGMLTSTSINAKTRNIVSKHTDYYYEVEDTMGKVISWLQANSKNMVDAFSSTNFNTHFTIGTPSYGTNEGQHFKTPTMVKMNGTNETPMLSNNSFFGTAIFPATVNIDTATVFDAATEYASADLGTANSRVVMVWAQETGGNYAPVFRVDVVTGNNPDRGVHSFSYLYSTLEFENSGGVGTGFLGELAFSTKNGNNKCFSYLFNHNPGPGTWSKGAPRANCNIASDGLLSIKSQINGNLSSNLLAGLLLRRPTGEVSGDTCLGLGCNLEVLTSISPWITSCPFNIGNNLTINSDTTLSADAVSHCWDTVNIESGAVLTLDSSAHPYHFKQINIDGELQFAPATNSDKITLYVEKLNSNNRINGNQLVNTNNAPHQVELIYNGLNNLKLNGNADVYVCLKAPLITVELQGNFDFYGMIHANQLHALGNGRLNVDEQCTSGNPTLSDMNFSLRKASQRYR